MRNPPVCIELDNGMCVLQSITAKEYYDFHLESLPIHQDYMHEMILQGQQIELYPDFNHPQLYAGLKTLFGESSTLYDDYKCSFGYPFLVKVLRKGKQSDYIMNFVDYKGSFEFRFKKILTAEEMEKYPDRRVLHKPLDDDFSQDEMNKVTSYLIFYLIGFMESFEERYDEEFARCLEYARSIYGYRENDFFLDIYEDEDEFWSARWDIKESGIPFNQVKPNP